MQGIRLVMAASISLSLWERAGVRAAIFPKFALTLTLSQWEREYV